MNNYFKQIKILQKKTLNKLMYKNVILITVLFFLVFATGCKDDSSEAEVKILVQNEFNLSMKEDLGAATRTLGLRVKTIKAEFCENTIINVSPNINNDLLYISIQDIPTPDCSSPIFFAAANVVLGVLEPQNYNLKITLKNVINNWGVLEVADDYYEIDMIDSDGILIKENRLYKIPKNTIWGYVAFENINQSVANNFINEVSGVSSARAYQDGYYGYFSVENNDLTILEEDFLHSKTNTFGFDFQGEVNDLETILSSYRSTYPSVEFKIFTSEGEVL